MRRTFNYTGRSRVTQNMVEIKLRWSSTSIHPTFIAKIDLDDFEFDGDLKVYIDAMRQDTMAFMRFDFGTVNNFTIPEDTLLTEFNRESKPKFYVKIIDEEESIGKIRADSIAIQAIDPEEVNQNKSGISLIHVVTEDLGDQIWKLKMPEQDNEVVDLVLNDQIEEVKGMFNEKWAAPLMLPNAVREILNHIVMGMKEEYNENGDQWYSLWLQFINQFYDEILPTWTDHNSDNDMQERKDWIEEAVGAFSTKMNFKTIMELELYGGLENES